MKIKRLLQLLPAAAIAAVTAVGFVSSTPVFTDIVMPVAAQEVSEETSEQTTEKKEITLPKTAEKKEASVTSSTYETPDEGYQDGTYSGSAQGFGGMITVEVVIKDGKIKSITVTDAPGETPSYMSSAKRIISSIVKEQSPNVDTISGATYSSNGIREAVKKALIKASADPKKAAEELAESTVQDAADTSDQKNAQTTGNNDSTIQVNPYTEPEDGYKDGTYTGSGEGFGGPITVSVTIKNQKITNILVTDAKDETPSFFEKAKAIIDNILSAQSPNVDTVSGATYSSNGIREAVKQALAKAEQKGTSTGAGESDNSDSTGTGTDAGNNGSGSNAGGSTAGSDGADGSSGEGAAESEKTGLEDLGNTSINGEFTGTTICFDEFGFSFLDYPLSIRLTLKEGVVTAISAPVVDTDAENADYTAFAATGTSRIPGVLTQLLAGKNAAEVDAVSGATCSSHAILRAYADAKEQALASVSQSETSE